MTLDLRRTRSWPHAEDARLAVIAGPDTGMELYWSGGDIYVGTGKSCDLALTDPAVSRRHCNLGPGGPSVHDLSSTNGTLVGNCPVSSAYLSAGAHLQLGQSRLGFDSGLTPRADDDQRFGLLLGRSDAMRALFAKMRQVANSASTVLLDGETGTGKEMVAETLHLASSRRHQPFRIFDCARVTPSLMELELFGHVRGAYTGAQHGRAGIFESAHRGTVFLDEIGELPLALQPKLLRVLDRCQLTRVGSAQPRQVDVRIVAATNRDLRSAVKEGRFRADLFYRLNVVRLTLPPLREREDDLELLANHFLRQLSGNSRVSIPHELLAGLHRHSWPGNVRELRNAVERWSVLDDPDDPRTPALAFAKHCNTLVHAAPEGRDSFRVDKAKALSDWERDYVARLIQRHYGNVSEAARSARMNRNHLRDLLRRHDLG